MYAHAPAGDQRQQTCGHTHPLVIRDNRRTCMHTHPLVIRDNRRTCGHTHPLVIMQRQQTCTWAHAPAGDQRRVPGKRNLPWKHCQRQGKWNEINGGNWNSDRVYQNPSDNKKLVRLIATGGFLKHFNDTCTRICWCNDHFFKNFPRKVKIEINS